MPPSSEASAPAGEITFTDFHNIINGELKTTAKTRHTLNPATGEPNLEVPVSTQQDLDEAVSAARIAQKSWAKTTFEERRAALQAYANALAPHREQFISLLISEQGKPSWLADDEFTRTLRIIKVTSEFELAEEVLQDTDDSLEYPLVLGMGKMAAAVCAGNAIIMKPSPDTPYTGLKYVELANQFFPPGVVQALSGAHDLGPMCTAHPGIDKISFTGSIATGKKVMESCAKTLKRVTLELGGNDAAIVCEDVEVKKIVPKIGILCFLNSGQICMDIKRLYVHSSIYDSFLTALIAYAKTLKVGPGTSPDTFIGPVQNEIQYARVNSFLEDITPNGQNIVLGGKNAEVNGTTVPKKGYFIPPTIISSPPDSSLIVREEPFGPIVPILAWTDESDVISRGNGTRFGLGASVWTADLDRGKRMARQLEAGSTWVNMHFHLDPGVPFGGLKESGVGREWGLVGLKGWCEVKSEWIGKGAVGREVGT